MIGPSWICWSRKPFDMRISMLKKFIFSRRARRAGRRENPEFWNFQNHENVKKWFQQDHYMEIWSRGILHNDVWYL